MKYSANLLRRRGNIVRNTKIVCDIPSLVLVQLAKWSIKKLIGQAWFDFLRQARHLSSKPKHFDHCDIRREDDKLRETDWAFPSQWLVNY